MKTQPQPDAQGHFGDFGGRYVPETLIPLILELEQAYAQFQQDAASQQQFARLRKHYIGRPSPLYHAQRLSDVLGGAQIYCKREELNHTGSHKINNCVGQILLARFMGKTRIIAETGAGQHGVAAATVCALFDLPCIVYMGKKDIVRQSSNVFRMKLLGAEVRAVDAGMATLKNAMNAALRDWASNTDDTYYCIGTAAGPHPYPQIVRDFQRIIGDEAREEFIEMTGKLPDTVVACIGGGSNAIGMFYSFLADDVRLIGVEAGGLGVDTGHHAASISAGKPGVLHGNKTYLLQSDDGQINDAVSISAGLDYPGIGPEHALLHQQGRVHYVSVTDSEALDGFTLMCQTEGIIPALEPAHAIAYIKKIAHAAGKNHTILMNLCGRGDKDINTVAERLGVSLEGNE